MAAAFALLAIAVGFIRGLRGWAAMSLGAVAMAGVLVVALVVETGSTWELMRYYPVKALWTSMIVVIPLAASGMVWLVATLFTGWPRRRSLTALATRGIVGLLVGVCAVGVLGRGAAFPPHLVTIEAGRAGPPNWSMAVIDSMKGVDIPAGGSEGAIVFGLVPSAGVGDATGGFVGMVDSMAMESLRFHGIPMAENPPVKSGLVHRTMTDICSYLRKSPNSLRITGPNVAAGPNWIVESGCPASIVKPAQWISLNIDSVWFERSRWQDGQWSFPTFDEVQQASIQG